MNLNFFDKSTVIGVLQIIVGVAALGFVQKFWSAFLRSRQKVEIESRALGEFDGGANSWEFTLTFKERVVYGDPIICYGPSVDSKFFVARVVEGGEKLKVKTGPTGQLIMSFDIVEAGNRFVVRAFLNRADLPQFVTKNDYLKIDNAIIYSDLKPVPEMLVIAYLRVLLVAALFVTLAMSSLLRTAYLGLVVAQ